MLRFDFFADAYLLKSGNKKEPYRVGGILTTEDRDTDGEIVKSVDWSYFTGGFGKIKYEHNDIKEPDCFVGFPTNLIKKGTQYHFEGELVQFDPELPEEKLTAQQRLAKSLVSLLQHIEEFNARHKGTPQKAGWSIEGEYLSKSPDGLVKARVVNVVFTTKPRNMKTLAVLLKSLDMGYGMTPETQTGFAAFRKESLEGSTKSQTNNEGERKMFKTFETIYKSCKDKGMTHEDATAEAKKQMAAKNKAAEDGFEAAEKSLSGTKDKLEKSIKELGDLSKITLDVDVDLHQTKMEKSIRTLQNAEAEEVDLGPLFKNQNEVMLAILKSQEVINKKFDILAKSVATVQDVLKDRIELDSFIQNITTDTNSEMQSLEKSIGVLVQKIAGQKGQLSSDKIKNLGVAENGDEGGEKKIAKSVMTNILTEMATKGEIEGHELIKFDSTGILSPETRELVKSKKPDLFK